MRASSGVARKRASRCGWHGCVYASSVSSSACSAEFAPYVPALRDMLAVNDAQRWEMHERRVEGTLEKVGEDREASARYYGEYMVAFNGMLRSANTDSECGQTGG